MIPNWLSALVPARLHPREWLQVFDSREWPQVFDSAAARRDAVWKAVALLLAVGLLTLATTRLTPELTDPERLRAAVASYGVFAPAVFVAVQTAQVIVAPLPGQILGGVGGFLFGTVWGTVYSLVGVTIGSTVVFLLSRHYGRPYVERVIDTDTLDRWDGFVSDSGRVGLFVLFLLPTFPDDVLCFVVGLSRLRLRTLIALVVFGRGPSFLVVAYAGRHAAGGQYGQTLAVLTALAVASAVVYAGRDRIVATFS